MLCKIWKSRALSQEPPFQMKALSEKIFSAALCSKVDGVDLSMGSTPTAFFDVDPRLYGCNNCVLPPQQGPLWFYIS